MNITGNYNTAVVYTAQLEEAAKEQIQLLCNQPFVADSQIRIMPDVHAGAGCTIGTTMTIKDKIVPNLVGVDIGCGMETIQIKNRHLELEKLDKLIYASIPSGFQVRKTPHQYAEEIDLQQLRCKKAVNLKRAYQSIGTLGGGNHFIEANQDSQGRLYLVVHSGSRHLGVEVAKYYQEAGYRAICDHQLQIDAIISELKVQGREQEIESTLQKRRKELEIGIPKQLAYVSGGLFDDYLHDMKLVQTFAMLNRKAMMQELIKGMKLKVVKQFTTIHNYIDTNQMILRKGAVSAQQGETLLIPINMRDGSLLCTGKGNAEWNYSAPHGAGRLMSRRQAKETYTVSEYQKQMKGIYTTSVSKETLDECPMAYKAMDEILEHLDQTAEITEVIKPIYNYKAAE